MTKRRWLARGGILGATAAICLIATTLLAKPGIVKTRDGSFSGEVTEADDGKVIVTVRGIPMSFNRRDVISIQYVDSPEDEFNKRLAGLAPQDVRGRLDLARWALQQQLFKQANQAAESALSADPNSREAIELQNMIRRQQDMDRAKANPPAAGGGGETAPANPAAGGNAPSPERKLLTNDDINIIRQKELSGREEFRVSFANDVRRRFAERDQRVLADFVRLPMTEQARIILERGTPEMKNDVRIPTDPAALLTFKQSIQPIILQGCATSGCHSGKTGGKLVLMSPAQTDQGAYTNFYILTQYSQRVGQAQISMIDRTQPARSLLLQYALATDTADVRHPDVPGYKGLFRTANDPRYKLMVDWLTSGLPPTQADYGIKYDIPTNAPASTQPAK